jgi:uncharacterized 2Fe-2S/4Fe-4S cluster protein (DUF4445 family)
MTSSRPSPDFGNLRRTILRQGPPGDPILITQADVRQVQFAKAAVRTGVDELLRQSELSAHSVDGVYVAGAFGSAMRAGALLALGMLPEVPIDRMHSVGNAAGLGAKLALGDPRLVRAMRTLARRVRIICLAEKPDFFERFSEAMSFPVARAPG